MGNKNKLPDKLRKEQMVKLFEVMYLPKCSIGCFIALMCGLSTPITKSHLLIKI